MAWGGGTFGETGLGAERDVAVPTRVELDGAVAVAAGPTSSAALTADGRVLTWGCGRDGRLGHGSSGANQGTPRVVEGLREPVTDVRLGEYFGLARALDGGVVSWGRRALGRASDGPPVGRVEGLVDAVAIACGREHALAATREGAVVSWGVGTSYALGHFNKGDVERPRAIAVLSGASRR